MKTISKHTLNQTLFEINASRKTIIKSILMTSAIVMTIASANASGLEVSSDSEEFQEGASPHPSLTIHSAPIHNDDVQLNCPITPIHGQSVVNTDSPYTESVENEAARLLGLYEEKLSSAREAQKSLSVFLAIVEINPENLNKALRQNKLGTFFGTEPTRETFKNYNRVIVAFMKWIVETYPSTMERLKQHKLHLSKAEAQHRLDLKKLDKFYKENYTPNTIKTPVSIQYHQTTTPDAHSYNESDPLLSTSQQSANAYRDLEAGIDKADRTSSISFGTKFKYGAVGATIATPLVASVTYLIFKYIIKAI